ncbi:MAG TPA: endonuclease/exonuclease/phosphatase family protein [Pyrinomonadaceae bacterium]
MSCPRRSMMRALELLLALALLCAPLNSRARAQSAADSSPLLETGNAAKLQNASASNASASPANIKIVSYNIRWRGGDDLRKLIALLRNDAEVGGATIIGLQEVDRNRKRTGNVNTARRMAEELGMYYAWAAPPPSAKARKPQEEETGVAILSLYPLTDVRRIVLPNEGPNGRRRVAVGATIRIKDSLLRVYSVHGETRLPVSQKIEALQAVLNDLAQHDKATASIVLGDFNTIEAEAIRDVTLLFTKAGFTTPFTNNEETWKTFIISLKLDWLWLRNLRAIEHGIDRKISLSDHWPLWTIVKLKE